MKLWKWVIIVDNEWQWEQEIIKLQNEIKKLRNEFATYKVDQIRELFSGKGLTYENITEGDICVLVILTQQTR